MIQDVMLSRVVDWIPEAVARIRVESVAWALVAIIATYYIFNYGRALRRRASGDRIGSPTAFVVRAFREDVRLVYVSVASLSAATLGWWLSPANFGAVIEGIISNVPALWGAAAVAISSATNAISVTAFSAIWVIFLAIGAAGVAYLMQTINLEDDD